jgi:thiol-disulfide isomerase/thioredoxin
MWRLGPFAAGLLLASACTSAVPKMAGGPTPFVTATAPLAATTPPPTLAPTTAPATDTPRPSPTAAPEGLLAPRIESDTWINSPPLDWDALRGKVVMVEFWTFDCINCRHVIPYLKGMDNDYRAQGLTIVGVHSPEFDYERELSNVKEAVEKMGIRYPVAIDNDFANWNRYRNRAWPTLYLVDKRGRIRYTHVGEEGYDQTRQWIERLLME